MLETLEVAMEREGHRERDGVAERLRHRGRDEWTYRESLKCPD